MTYPNTAPEIAIPELDGKTAKMYRWVRRGGGGEADPTRGFELGFGEGALCSGRNLLLFGGYVEEGF